LVISTGRTILNETVLALLNVTLLDFLLNQAARNETCGVRITNFEG